MRPAGNWIVRLAVALFAVVAAGPMPAARAQAQQEAAADDPVTDDEIGQRIQLREVRKTYSREQAIAELREEKRKIREALKAGVEVLATEVDAEYARMARRMNVTVAQLTANLAQAGVGPETIKHRLRADITWQRYQESRQQP